MPFQPNDDQAHHSSCSQYSRSRFVDTAAYVLGLRLIKAPQSAVYTCRQKVEKDAAELCHERKYVICLLKARILLQMYAIMDTLENHGSKETHREDDVANDYTSNTTTALQLHDTYECYVS